MQNILTVQPRDIRPHVRLAHYANLDFSALPPHDAGRGDKEADADADRPTVESVTALRRRLQASQKLNLALHREKTRNETLLRDLRELLGVSSPAGVKREDTEQDQQQPSSNTGTFGFLAQGRAQLTSVGSSTPITTTTQFTLSQLQALRALSTSLRTLLPSLSSSSSSAAPSDEAAGVRKTWRRERAGYVETSSRKYLENASGLELGTQGEVRDGEYQGEGRALSKADVEGLESAVAMLEKVRAQQNDPGTKGGPATGGEAMDES